MKFISLISYCLLATCLSTSAQTIILQKLKGNSCVVTPGTITLSAEKIILQNTTLKCEKLILNDQVKFLVIDGMVEITCTDVEMNCKQDIAVSGSGTLNIKFSNAYKENGHSLSIADAGKLTIAITKSMPD